MNCPLTLRRLWHGDLHALSGPLVTAGWAYHHDNEYVRASWCRQDSLRFAVMCTGGALAIEARHVASSHVRSGWTLRLLRQTLSGLRDVKSASPAPICSCESGTRSSDFECVFIGLFASGPPGDRIRDTLIRGQGVIASV